MLFVEAHYSLIIFSRMSTFVTTPPQSLDIFYEQSPLVTD